MMGGGMMGVGLLAMLAILAVPVLIVAGLVAAAAGLFSQKPANAPPANVSGAVVPPIPQQIPQPPAAPAARYCSHCGQGLQAGWSHCPYCGAPVSA